MASQSSNIHQGICLPEKERKIIKRKKKTGKVQELCIYMLHRKVCVTEFELR